MALLSRLFFSAVVRYGIVVRIFLFCPASLSARPSHLNQIQFKLATKIEIFFVCAPYVCTSRQNSLMASSFFFRIVYSLPLLFAATQGFAANYFWLGASLKPELALVSPASPHRTDNALSGSGDNAWHAHWVRQLATEHWNEEASRLIVKYRVNPLRSVRTLTLMHVTMHDAHMHTEQLGLGQPALAAATHIAASRLLAHSFPLEPAGRLEAMGESALATLVAESPQRANEIAHGAEIGRHIAQRAILRALNDGADEVWDLRTRPDAKPGMWQGAPPLDSAHPQEPLAGFWQPWVLKSGSELKPPPPPAPDSEAFLRASKEVLHIGRNLTPEQKRIAEDWHLDQGTVTPPGLWNRKARTLAVRRDLPEKERLRLMSMLNVAMLDASIACWHAKYSWWVQRPVTTIREQLDPNFMPLLVTPPHPSYVSGHATVSGAASEILKRRIQE